MWRRCSRLSLCPLQARGSRYNSPMSAKIRTVFSPDAVTACASRRRRLTGLDPLSPHQAQPASDRSMLEVELGAEGTRADDGIHRSEGTGDALGAHGSGRARGAG